MAKRVVEKTTEYFNDAYLANYINQETKNTFPKTATAILILGLSLVSTLLEPRVTSNVAEAICKKTGILALAMTVGDVIRMMVDEGYEDRQIVLNTIKEKGYGGMSVTTTVYEYSTGSGNSYTYITETIYNWIGK